MRVVAESKETLRVPITAVIADQLVDPSQSGGRAVTVALIPQGTAPTAPAFSITGTWEIDNTHSPTRYWVAFITPGNLTRGIDYQTYIAPATAGGETPWLEVPNLVEAV